MSHTPSEAAQTVFITGANGFVGSHLTRALVSKGARVRALIRPKADRSRLAGVPVDWIEGDLDDIHALQCGASGAQRVVHNAGRVRAPNHGAYQHANCVGTTNLLDAVQDTGTQLERFVYISSMAAGGPSFTGKPRTETDPDSPITPYGTSKLAGERAVMSRATQLPVVALRPPAIYGPEDMAVLGFFQAVGWRIKPVFGPQPQRMSIVHVQDLVDAILLALESPHAPGEMFYIAEDRSYELSELEELIQEALGVRAVPINIPRSVLLPIAWACDMTGKALGFTPRLNRDKARDFLQRDWTCSTAKANRLLGYQSHIPFAEGARQTVQWYREKEWL